MNDAKLAIAYLRVSTEDQNLGPEAQRAQITAWAVRQGVTIAAWHEDHGLSGGLPAEKRPGLMAAVQAVKDHKAGWLVAAKRDRIGRDVMVTLLLERLVKRAGGRVATADGVTSGDRPEDFLMRGMVDNFAQYERLLIGSRTKAAMAVKRERGERVGDIPYGYRLADGGKMLEVDAVEQEALAKLRSYRASMSLRAVVARLNDEGVPARGSRWHLTTVARLARQEAA